MWRGWNLIDLKRFFWWGVWFFNILNFKLLRIFIDIFIPKNSDVASPIIQSDRIHVPLEWREYFRFHLEYVSYRALSVRDICKLKEFWEIYFFNFACSQKWRYAKSLKIIKFSLPVLQAQVLVSVINGQMIGLSLQVKFVTNFHQPF